MLYRRYNSANTFQKKTEAQTNHEPTKPPHSSGSASQMPHGGANQAARHGDTYGANSSYGANNAHGSASQMPHSGINSGEPQHQDKSSFPHFEHTNSQNYGQTPKNAVPQSGWHANPPHGEQPHSGCRQNPPHKEPPHGGNSPNPPHKEPPHGGNSPNPPHGGGKKSLDISKIIEGFIPSALYNPQTRKFLGLIGAEDLLLLALIFLIMENDREKDPTLLIALIYILASEYIDLPDLTF